MGRNFKYSDKVDPSVPEFNFCGYDEKYIQRLEELSGVDFRNLDRYKDLEKAIKLCSWVHSKWTHSGTNLPERGDPITILLEAKCGKRFRCVEYSTLLHAVLTIGRIRSRVIYLRSADVETRKSGAGHVVVEAFIREHMRWVMFDPQINVYATKDGIPISSLELGVSLENDPESISFPTIGKFMRRRYIKFIKQYLYYLHSDLKMAYPQDYPRAQVVLMPSGAPIPVKFQGMPIKETIIPTISYVSFYPDQVSFLLTMDC
ncbi:MAG: transglutaminase-like domain-containing protein [Cuniculiplasma sp.]